MGKPEQPVNGDHPFIDVVYQTAMYPVEMATWIAHPLAMSQASLGIFADSEGGVFGKVYHARLKTLHSMRNSKCIGACIHIVGGARPAVESAKRWPGA